MPHFSWDVSLGSILTALSVMGAALKFHGDWRDMVREHKLMWFDYCQRHHIARDPDCKKEAE